MPYIITTHKPDHATWSCNDSRRAVATLEDARDYVRENYKQLIDQWMTSPESGGTVGPLPDGTVIEVEFVDMWSELMRRAGMEAAGAFPSYEQIIAAFNDTQAVKR